MPHWQLSVSIAPPFEVASEVLTEQRSARSQLERQLHQKKNHLVLKDLTCKSHHYSGSKLTTGVRCLIYLFGGKNLGVAFTFKFKICLLSLTLTQNEKVHQCRRPPSDSGFYWMRAAAVHSQKSPGLLVISNSAKHPMLNINVQQFKPSSLTQIQSDESCYSCVSDQAQ